MIDITLYSFALVGARAAFLAATGREPWQDLTGFLLVFGGFWAGNNATKPARVAAAAALAPLVGRATTWVEAVLPGAVHQTPLPGLHGVALSTVASPAAAARRLGRRVAAPRRRVRRAQLTP